jgi:hypothetical protein
MWEVLVPCTFEDNKKPVSYKHHKKFDEYVLKLAGGITIFKPVSGQWFCDGVTYSDRVIPVRIACNKEKILKIANFAKNHYRQIAIFVYKISDEVILV